MYTDRKFSAAAEEAAKELLKGAYDWHIHNGPAIFPRRADDAQIVAEAVEAGMAGVGFKVHEGDTAARAKMLDKTTSCRVYGGVCLNHFVGGLNPAAVEASLATGGKFVWLPTMASRQHVDFYSQRGAFLGGKQKHNSGKGITVIDDSGNLIPVMLDIFDLIRSYDAVLSTGHLSPEEAVAVAREFTKTKGKGAVVMGHPDLNNCQAPIEAQVEFAKLGGYVEKMVLALHPDWGHVPVEAFVTGMRRIGLEHCTITTDAGGPDRGSSPQTLARFIALVLEEKLMTDRELRIVLTDVSQGMLEGKS